jgi:hypothetical protein
VAFVEMVVAVVVREEVVRVGEVAVEEGARERARVVSCGCGCGSGNGVRWSGRRRWCRRKGSLGRLLNGGWRRDLGGEF